MKIDALGLIELEKDPEGSPGRIGDSCAETFRYYHLKFFVDHINHLNTSEYEKDRENVAKAYTILKTPTGYLRHPNVPLDWREKDFAADQGIPMYLCLWAYDLPFQGSEMESHFQEAGWRTGNGDLLPPTFFVARERSRTRPFVSWDLSLWGQALAFRYLPFRWSDDKNKKWYERIERTSASSADWLNFLHLLIQCEYRGHTWASRRAKNTLSVERFINKIVAYYQDEPNNWAVGLYVQAIKKLYFFRR